METRHVETQLFESSDVLRKRIIVIACFYVNFIFSQQNQIFPVRTLRILFFFFQKYVQQKSSTSNAYLPSLNYFGLIGRELFVYSRFKKKLLLGINTVTVTFISF